jgi:hypothetical protein
MIHYSYDISEHSDRVITFNRGEFDCSMLVIDMDENVNCLYVLLYYKTCSKICRSR